MKKENTNPYYFLGMYFGTVRSLVSDKDMREFQDGIVWYINRNLTMAFARVTKWIENHRLHKLIQLDEDGYVTDKALAKFSELGGEVVKVMSDRDACAFWAGYCTSECNI
jgi:hypothetical protein